MLENIDVLVFDIQDIGVRSYTFNSTMGLAMEAAAEHGLEMVILDRPNPLGGDRVEGSLVQDGYISFIRCDCKKSKNEQFRNQLCLFA